MYNVFWQLKPQTLINLRIPHLNIYELTAVNRIITKLHKLGILKPHKYMVAMVTQCFALHQLNNMPQLFITKNI